jgi:hypothetical protein
MINKNLVIGQSYKINQNSILLSLFMGGNVNAYKIFKIKYLSDAIRTTYSYESYILGLLIIYCKSVI